MNGVSDRLKKNDILYLVCFTVSILAMAMILVALPFKIDVLVSAGASVIAAASLVLLIAYFFECPRILPWSAAWFLLLAVVTVLAAVCTTPTGITDRIVKSLCFFEIPIFMLSLEKKIKIKYLPIVFWVQYALSWYFVYLSTTEKAYYFEGEYADVVLDQLTLGYNNPNETAIYLFLCIMVLCCATLYFKSFILRCLFLVNAVLVFRLIVLTESRAGMLIALFSAVLFVLRKKLKVKRSFAKIALAIPLVAVVIIVNYYEKLVDMKFWGDPLETGRLNVFNQVFNGLQVHEILLGDFATHLFGNLHNAYISIFGTIGTLGAIAFAVFLYMILKYHCPKSKDAIWKKIGFMNVLLIIMHSAVESALLVSGSAYAVGFMCVYSLAVAED